MLTLNPSPSANLLEKILNRIHKEERILVLRRLIIFSITLVASVVAFFPATGMLISQSKNSGFISFSSLMFSDFSTVIIYWRSFTMIILETLPAVGIALFLAVLLTFLQSARSLAKNVKIIIKATA